MDKEEKDIYSIIGSRIKCARLSYDMTQEELAKILGMSRPSIVNIEQGKQGVSLIRFIDLVNALNIDPSEILEDIICPFEDFSEEESSLSEPFKIGQKVSVVVDWKNGKEKRITGPVLLIDEDNNRIVIGTPIAYVVAPLNLATVS